MAQRLRVCMLLPVAGLVVACSQPSAIEVCHKLEAAGVAEGCLKTKKQRIKGPAAIAKERAEFHIPGLTSERPSEVLTFNEDREYVLTMKTYGQLGTLNALHRFGSRDELVFVAIDDKIKPELAEKAKKVIEEL